MASKQFSNWKPTPIGSQSRKAAPVRAGIGRRNIRISDQTSGAALGRKIEEAFSLITGDLTHYFRQVEDALPEDMLGALEPAYMQSQIYCPKDKLKLVESAYFAEEKFRGGSRVEIGYARDGDPDYAVFVHEMPYKHAEPTRSKFLEVAIDEDYHNILQRITDNVRRRMGL